VTSYGYDFRGRQTSQTLPDPDGAGALTAPLYQTEYDNLNRVIKQTDGTGLLTTLGHYTTYDYDAAGGTKLGRLAEVDLYDKSGTKAETVAYTFDPFGRRGTGRSDPSRI